MNSQENRTLVNGSPVDVESVDGKKSTVSLRTLTIRQRYEFAHHVRGQRTPELVALCCGQPIEWVDTLTPESFADLAGRCVTENFQIAMAMAQKDPVMATIIGPVVAEGVMSIAAMLPATNGATGSASSPAPATSESAAATGSGSST